MFKFGNLAAMMGNLQKLPQAITEMTARLQEERFEVEIDQGIVVAQFNGIGEMVSIDFDGQAHESGVLQEAVKAAASEGHMIGKQRYAAAMQEVAAGLKLDGLPGLDGALASLTGGQ
ncbi:hypothetical protein FF011L_14790 [Roseimaritima multifibrata]|uniref:Nucleoid-associated protein YbaB n=1 Tax=Roseimaritima multifibrata TaxID=1930274 RepID=A0A517MCW7_9BACT|nr:YbaB/EbfC family nucleoid-associated protein [Roseimaritima multifibrata]QDS92730.1 hypothetical protein FF011L_14790 [Roseimaritima multifibrata]